MKKRDICPIVQSHKRLLEAHRLWHQALENYFDPEGFRTNINAAIQTLRNLTFALQNEKRNIPNFDSWYPAWVVKLKQDRIMAWLCDARTEIVHKKDLELYSKATITIQNYETILVAKMDIPIFISGKLLLNFLLEKEKIEPEMKRSGAFATVERKWVADSYPEQELLYVVAYGIGSLFSMIKEAHQLSSIMIDSCSVIDTLHNFELSKDNIPICMEFTKKPMQEKIGLTDFLTRVESFERIELNPYSALKRYKKILKNNKINIDSDPYVMADSLFSYAKQMLAFDKFHAAILYYQTLDLKWNMMSPAFDDRTSKFIFWQNFAERVQKENIVSLIFLSESWVGSMEELQANGTYPADQKEHKEALCLNIFTKDLRSKGYSAIFCKSLVGKIKFEETIIEENIFETAGYIQPVLKVWTANAG